MERKYKQRQMHIWGKQQYAIKMTTFLDSWLILVLFLNFNSTSLVPTNRRGFSSGRTFLLRRRWKWQSWREAEESTIRICNLISRFYWYFLSFIVHEKDTWCYTYFNGYIRRPLSIPGVYDKMHANTVSNTKPKFNAQFLKT